MLESSLGNFINPLFNMLCGVIFFRDRVSRLQWAAVVLVAIAIAIRVVSLGYFPWVALSLCTTFSVYGMIRKIVPVESIPGLVVENMLFTPFAIAILFWLSGTAPLAFGTNIGTTALLLGAGLVTTLPMFLFAYAARHLNLTTLGIFHYIVPTLQFMLGVFVFREPFSTMNFASFAIIWAALVVYSYEKLRQKRVPVR